MAEKTIDIPANMELCAMPLDEAEIIAGRRDFFVYRDFGVEAASKGLMRVQTQTAKSALEGATGWHYHECGAQLVYVISGWAELSFEDGSTQRLSAGAVLFIPGGYRHNEIVTSDDYSALEVVVPGEDVAPGQMKTQACEAPAAFLTDAPSG